MKDDEVLIRPDRIENLLTRIANNTQPESFPERLLNTVAAAAGILGVVAVVDQIIKWVRG